MADLPPVAFALTPTPPIADARDLLDAPAPARPDAFGPAVVFAPSEPQRPALVVYDAQGRLTTPVPPGSGVLPPRRIDAGDPDAPRSLVYTS